MALPLSYNWRNLIVRRYSSGLTFAVVAIVVFVLAILLSFAEGIRASLGESGSALNVLVIKPGATSESTSIIRTHEVAQLRGVSGVQADADGQPLLSQELCVQAAIPRRNDPDSIANVAVRGVDDVALQVHRSIQVVEGRWLRQGQLEIVVGRAAAERFANLTIGSRLPLGRVGNRAFEVVGVFEAGGGAFESEILAPRTMLSDVYDRPFVSSVVMTMQDEAALRSALDYIASPAAALDGKRETAYYADLSSKTREIVVLTSILIGIMAAGAVFAVANTMYAAVDGRRREVAMLRTIGFSRGAIVISFLVESLLLCVTACLTGLLASLAFNGRSQDFFSDVTFTVLAYELRLTPQVFVAALLTSAAVGIIGALAPALRASRTRIIEALRKA